MTEQQPEAGPRPSAPSASSAAVPPPPPPPAPAPHALGVPPAPQPLQGAAAPLPGAVPPAQSEQGAQPAGAPYAAPAPSLQPVVLPVGQPPSPTPPAGPAPGLPPLSPAPVQTPAGAPGAVTTELRRLVTGPGLLTWAALAAVALVTAIVSGLLLLWTLDIVGGSVPGASVVSQVLVGGGVALGGRLSVVDGTGVGSARADLVALGPLLIIGVATALVVRHRARLDSAPATLGALVTRSLAEAAATGILSALVLGIPSVSLVSNEQDLGLLDLTVALGAPTASASWGRVLVLTLVATALGSLIGRWSVCRYLPLPAWVQRLRPLWAEVSASLVALGAVLGCAAVLTFVAAAIEGRAALLLLAPLLLPNVGVWIASLGSFSGLSVAGSVTSFGLDLGSAGSHYVSTPSLPHASGWLCVLVVLIAVLAVAARVGVRRQRALGVQWGRVWQLPAAFWLLWAVLMGLGGALSAVGRSSLLWSGSLRVGPATVALLTVPLACLLSSVLAEVVPLYLYTNAPGLLLRVGGREAVTRWAAGVPLYPAATAAVPQGPVPGAGQVPVPVAPAPAGSAPVASSAPLASAASAAAAPGAPVPGAPVPGQQPTWASGPGVSAASAPLTASVEPATEVITPAGPMVAPVPPPPPTGASAPVAFSAPVAGSAALPGSLYTAQPVGAVPVGAPGALPQVEAPRPMSASTRRNVRLGLIAVAVLMVAGIVVGVWAHVQNASRTPEAAVRDYVQLIADGRLSEATKQVDPGVPNAERVLLSDAAASGRTSTMSIESVDEAEGASLPSRDGDLVPVTVTYQVDGERLSQTLSVRRASNEMVLLHRWTVQDALVEKAQISGSGVPSVTVGSAEVPLDVTSPSGWDTSESPALLGGTADVYVYPGTYTVRGPSTSSKYVTVDEVSLSATDTSGTTSVTVTAEASDDLRAAVLKAVEDKVASCGSTAGNMDHACPYQVQSTDLAAIEVKTLPAEVTDLTTTSFTSGEATITIKPNPTLFDDNPSSRDIDFTMSGTIELKADGSAPTITVTSSSGW